MSCSLQRSFTIILDKHSYLLTRNPFEFGFSLPIKGITSFCWEDYGRRHIWRKFVVIIVWLIYVSTFQIILDFRVPRKDLLLLYDLTCFTSITDSTPRHLPSSPGSIIPPMVHLWASISWVSKIPAQNSKITAQPQKIGSWKSKF